MRVIRDQIELRVADLLEHRIDAIRADRTAHQLRLQRLLPGLIERFPEKLPDDEVRSCADAVLAEYIDVPVRSFVATIADRKARECLASGAAGPRPPPPRDGDEPPQAPTSPTRPCILRPAGDRRQEHRSQR